MADNSFDVVSNVDFQEVRNAVSQAEKEIVTRYDLKKAAASVKLEGEEFTLESSDEFTLQQALEVVKTKLVRRDVNLKSLRPGKLEAGERRPRAAEVLLPERHPAGDGEEDRGRDQDLQDQGAGLDPERHGARLGQEPRRPAGGHRAAARRRFRRAAFLHQLPQHVIRRALLPALAAACLLAPPATAERREGEAVEITGGVSDAHGVPVGGLEVALEASRSRFDLRTLRRVPGDTRRAAVVADERGNFTIDWSWVDGFDRFELVAGLRVRKAGGERFVELARADLSHRMGQGSPVVATLEVADTRLLEAMRQFLAALRSDDERRTYEELGKPDQVDVVQGPGWTESTWWYFEDGRACRFRDGRRVDVRTFDPIRRF